MIMDCIFCQIASGKIPGDIVYEDEEVIAFRDINPKAPVHLLIIPRKHITSLDQMKESDAALVGRMVAVGA
ncbi:MAG: HIT domain-containing protein [Dehalococcoidia bacterium]|nr:HIT domain-containing protein [Dehalococcoidia bacterium]